MTQGNIALLCQCGNKEGCLMMGKSGMGVQAALSYDRLRFGVEIIATDRYTTAVHRETCKENFNATGLHAFWCASTGAFPLLPRARASWPTHSPLARRLTRSSPSLRTRGI